MMQPKTLTIYKPSKNGRKTREFSVTLLAAIHLPPAAFPLADGTGFRLVFMAYAGSEQESRAFTANFRGGAPAKLRPHDTLNEAYYAPKSAGYRWLRQPLPGRVRGTLTLAYIERFFRREPFQTNGEVAFVLMPPERWLSAQAERLEGLMGDDAREAALGVLFASFLDKRSLVPLVQDIRFHVQLLRAAVAQHLLFEADAKVPQFWTFGLKSIGLAKPLLCLAEQDSLDEFLAAQTTEYFESGLHVDADRFRPNALAKPGAAQSGRLVQPYLPLAA